MNKRQLILGLVLLAALVALAFYAQHRHPINWHEVIEQFALSRWSYFGIGLGCIYVAYIFRATRWAYLLRHHKKVNPLSLVGSQVMGFTAVSLIGRVADPVRPIPHCKENGAIDRQSIRRLRRRASLRLRHDGRLLLRGHDCPFP